MKITVVLEKSQHDQKWLAYVGFQVVELWTEIQRDVVSQALIKERKRFLLLIGICWIINVYTTESLWMASSWKKGFFAIVPFDIQMCIYTSVEVFSWSNIVSFLRHGEQTRNRGSKRFQINQLIFQACDSCFSNTCSSAKSIFYLKQFIPRLTEKPANQF